MNPNNANKIKGTTRTEILQVMPPTRITDLRRIEAWKSSYLTLLNTPLS
jgi:hypothetical protein